jgi:hypothetical protein
MGTAWLYNLSRGNRHWLCNGHGKALFWAVAAGSAGCGGKQPTKRAVAGQAMAGREK